MDPIGDIIDNDSESGDELAPTEGPTKTPSWSSQKISWSQRADLHSCIVKLTVQSVSPSYTEPWRTREQSARAGTGFLISGRRVVTNAHVVHRSSHVRARKSSSPIMFSCTVEWISIPLDLAVLTLNPEGEREFFDGGSSNSISNNGGKEYLELSPVLPRLDENVTCVGFPTGGAQISVTRGVVSRVDVNGTGVLRIQIDAAINRGNSGGPVFDESGRVVGVASSHLKGGSNIGYIIPVEVLSQFLRMCEDGIEACPVERSVLNVGGTSDLVGLEGPKMVPGIMSIGIFTQSLESKVLRRRLSLNEERDGRGCGVRVAGIWLPSSEVKETMPETRQEPPLYVDDVLMTVDGVDVGQDATVSLSEDRPDERINLVYLYTRHQTGQELALGILRNGKPMTIRQTLVPMRHMCPMYDSFDAHASYVVCGGCVFVPLSGPFISANTSKSRRFPFRSRNRPAQGDEQIIVLSKVLADDSNVGYHSKRWLTLKTVNGSKPTNIRQLVKLIVQGGNEPLLEFRLNSVDQEEFDEQLIVLDVEECRKAESRILKQHMIASWCSEDAIPLEMKGSGEVSKTMVSLLEHANSNSTDALVSEADPPTND